MYSNTSPSQEQELVLKLINDDENAFCELYSIYRNRLIYFAMRYLKSRDFAEDIFQDTFTIVWQSRKFINLDSSFSAYLYTIMRNRILNMLRDLEYQEQLKDYFVVSSCRCKRQYRGKDILKRFYGTDGAGYGETDTTAKRNL